MSWYLKALKQYAVFSGRAQRKEYWLFFLFTLIMKIVLMFIDNVAGLTIMASGNGLLSILYTLAVLLPFLAVSARRLHDTTHSGWWVLICLVPLVGGTVYLRVSKNAVFGLNFLPGFWTRQMSCIMPILTGFGPHPRGPKVVKGKWPI